MYHENEYVNPQGTMLLVFQILGRRYHSNEILSQTTIFGISNICASRPIIGLPLKTLAG